MVLRDGEIWLKICCCKWIRDAGLGRSSPDGSLARDERFIDERFIEVHVQKLYRNGAPTIENSCGIERLKYVGDQLINGFTFE